MEEHDLTKSIGEISNTKLCLIHTNINLMRVEVSFFFLDSFFDSNLINNILFGSILDSNVTMKKWYVLALEHSFCISTPVHDIDLSDSSDCSDTLRIQLHCHLETIRGSDISISGTYTQNNSHWISTILSTHRFCNLFNILRLILNCNTCDTRQINES